MFGIDFCDVEMKYGYCLKVFLETSTLYAVTAEVTE